MTIKIHEHNTETNEIIERNATIEELTNIEAGELATAQRIADETAKAAAKAAVLAKLGLTEDELKAALA